MTDHAKGNGAPKNPFLKAVAETAAVVAALEKIFEPARDEFCLADAEKRSLEREIAAAPLLADGRPDVSAATKRKYERACRRREAARAGYEDAARELSEARGQLTDAQRALAEWDRRETFWAEQRAAEAALTPEERERRRIRALLDAERAIPR